MFSIATMVDLRFKLEHIPQGAHKFIMEILLNILESMHIVEASSSMPIDDRLASRTDNMHIKLLLHHNYHVLDHNFCVYDAFYHLKMKFSSI